MKVKVLNIRFQSKTYIVYTLRGHLQGSNFGKIRTLVISLMPSLPHPLPLRHGDKKFEMWQYPSEIKR